MDSVTDPEDPDEIASKMDAIYQQLWDENTELSASNRESAIAMFALADKYDELASLAREQATLHLIHSKVLGGALSDLLLGQFSLKAEEEPILDEDDDDPDDGVLH